MKLKTEVNIKNGEIFFRTEHPKYKTQLTFGEAITLAAFVDAPEYCFTEHQNKARAAFIELEASIHD